VSRLRIKLSFGVDVLDVEADVLLGGLEQLSHGLLGQPHGLAVEADVDLEPASLVGIDKELTQGSFWLTHVGTTSSKPIMPQLTDNARS
jgi:hypothetical protein